MTGSGLAGLEQTDRAAALLDRLIDELEGSVISLGAMEESLDELLVADLLDESTTKLLGSVREELRGTLVLTEESQKEVIRLLTELD